jgi:hypothetical protein
MGTKNSPQRCFLGLPGHRLRIIGVMTPKEGAPGPMQVPLKLKLVSRAANNDGRLLKDAATSTLAQAPERRNCEFVPVGNAPRGYSNAEAAWLDLLLRRPEPGENPAGTKAREPFVASLAQTEERFGNRRSAAAANRYALRRRPRAASRTAP